MHYYVSFASLSQNFFLVIFLNSHDANICIIGKWKKASTHVFKFFKILSFHRIPKDWQEN